MGTSAADREQAMQAACQAADYGRAATLALEAYAGEILALLISRLRSESSGHEVFAMFAEKLWVGLPAFEWRCSMRAYCYRIARNAANDYTSAAANRPERNLALSQVPWLGPLVDRARTATQRYRRSEVKDRVRQLRDKLPADDQMLLILRVDRAMDWRELAIAMGGERGSQQAVEREAARLRKRFERIKTRLRELAREDGLL